MNTRRILIRRVLRGYPLRRTKSKYDDNIKRDLGVDVTGSGSCPMVTFGVSGTEPSGSDTTALTVSNSYDSSAGNQKFDGDLCNQWLVRSWLY
jgi:hypothetical protein